MLEVRFGSPEDRGTEPFLTWWHIPVMVNVKGGWRGLASVYELQCGVGTERWIDEDFSSVGCIA